ncbi:DUF3606 domain-containing protein [Undibacterium sp. Di27W]|uniref:DUF3606 domain-containing protein n=1 Tax=Undibacterium sp. Di27W TaxID=3413036 RepID=UPI003BEFC69B
MTDNLQNRGPRDASRVNVSEPWDVAYWTRKFDCTKDELVNAVQEVGTSAVAVEKQLKH